MVLKRLLLSLASAGSLAVGALAFLPTSASAYIVCDRDGDDCWHAEHRYRNVPGIHFEYHPDGWYFGRDWDHDRDHHWHARHEGRGYWRNGVWITF